MVRNTLIVLEMVIACAAVVGGLYAMLGAPRVPRQWLQDTLFRSYVWPGAALLILVGGSMAAAVALLIGEASSARVVSLEAGIVMLGWMTVQLSMIGYRHWTQLLSIGLGIAVVALAFALPAPG
jgi:hypothetical protein